MEQEIHVSKEANYELELTGEFKIDYRGEVYLKGRGNMACYWLRGIKNPENDQPARKSTQRQSVGPVQIRTQQRRRFLGRTHFYTTETYIYFVTQEIRIIRKLFLFNFFSSKNFEIDDAYIFFIIEH